MSPAQSAARTKTCPKFRLKSPNFIYKSSKIVSIFSQKSYQQVDDEDEQQQRREEQRRVAHFARGRRVRAGREQGGDRRGVASDSREHESRDAIRIRRVGGAKERGRRMSRRSGTPGSPLHRSRRRKSSQPGPPMIIPFLKQRSQRPASGPELIGSPSSSVGSKEKAQGRADHRGRGRGKESSREVERVVPGRRAIARKVGNRADASSATSPATGRASAPTASLGRVLARPAPRAGAGADPRAAGASSLAARRPGSSSPCSAR